VTSPTLELQKAIHDRLVSFGPLAALVADRVLDLPDASTPFPYVTFGASDDVSDDAECIEVAEVTFQIDAWSTDPGYPEVRQIANAIRAALRDFEPTLPVNALVELRHRQTRFLRERDGIISHAALTFEATIEVF